MDVHTTEVTLEGLGKVVISTSDVDYIVRPETCLFWGKPDKYGFRDNIVIETYNDWPSAVQGHVRWTADIPAVAKRISDYLRDAA